MQSQGIVFETNSTGWAGTWVPIASLTKLPFPKKSRGYVDMSALDSPDNYEEGEKEILRRTSEMDFEYNTKDANIDAIDALVEADGNEFCRITIPGVTKKYWFKLAFLEHDPGDAQVGTPKITGKFKGKISGKIYRASSAPS